jgi:hypothetical protein
MNSTGFNNVIFAGTTFYLIIKKINSCKIKHKKMLESLFEE